MRVWMRWPAIADRSSRLELEEDDESEDSEGDESDELGCICGADSSGSFTRLLVVSLSAPLLTVEATRLGVFSESSSGEGISDACSWCLCRL